MENKIRMPRFVANRSLIDLSEVKFYSYKNDSNAKQQNRIQPQRSFLEVLPITYAICYWACIAGGGDWVGCGDDCRGAWG
jgi:hypothetical protein